MNSVWLGHLISEIIFCECIGGLMCLFILVIVYLVLVTVILECLPLWLTILCPIIILCSLFHASALCIATVDPVCRNGMLL